MPAGQNAPPSFLQNLAKTGPLPWLLMSALAATITMAFLTLEIAAISKEQQSRQAQELEAEELHMQILRSDENLTSSALLYAKTSDPAWRSRYELDHMKLERLLARSQQLSEQDNASSVPNDVAGVRRTLAELETRSFALVTSLRLDEAWEVLTGPEYQEQRNRAQLTMSRSTTGMSRTRRLAQLAALIRYLDDVLTNSARLFAVTGDPAWDERYAGAALAVESALEEAEALCTNPALGTALELTESANDELIALEAQSLALSRQRQLDRAHALLDSDTYRGHKAEYDAGLTLLISALAHEVAVARDSEQTRLLRRYLVVTGVVVGLGVCFALVAVFARRWHRQLVRKHNDLQSLNEELELFAYRTSHDLKGPLTTSKNLAGFIESDIDAGNLDEAKTNACRIRAQMESLEGVVVSLLSLARSNLKQESATALDMEQVMSQLELRLAWLTEAHPCRVEQHISLSEPVYGEGVRYSQIIENLVSNGIKYRNVSTGDAYVKVSVTDDSDKIYIEVADNGIGIPDELQDQAFEMFSRLHPTACGGAGLGLSIVKKHVDHLGGEIQLESSKTGSSFQVTVPKVKAIVT